MAEATDEVMRTLVDTTSAAIQVFGPADGAPWLFTRCWLHVVSFNQRGRRPADLSAALADFDRLPAAAQGRPKLAQVLVNAMLRSGRFTDHLDRAVALCRVAAEDPRPHPEWPRTAATVRAIEVASSFTRAAPGVSLRAGLAEVEDLARVVGDQQPFAQMVGTARMGISAMLGATEGDLSRLDNGIADAERLCRSLAELAPGNPRVRSVAATVKALAEAQAAIARGDVGALGSAIAKAEEATATLPEDDPARVRARAVREIGMSMLSVVETAGGGVTSDELIRLRALSDESGLPPHVRAMRLVSLGAAELASAGSLRPLDTAIDHLREALELSTEDDPRRVEYLMTLGMAYVRRVEKLARRADLAEGIRLLERARELAGVTHHRHWTMISNPLAHAYRLAGDDRRGRETALDALRGHAWNVLLQANTADTETVARDATSDALVVARWCVEDDDAGSAAVALDAGRASILFAAVETRDLRKRLTDAGRAKLAERWREAVAEFGDDQVPGPLRREVIAALAGVPITADGTMTAAPATGSAKLLSPPDLDEMRAALSALGADVLAYLVPGEEGPGFVVTVPAEGDPTWFPLAMLSKRGAAGFDAFLTATTVQARSGRDAGGDRSGEVRKTLDEVCQWAWTVAIGPLLERCPPRPGGGPPRVVLIPMGELVRIPWHAACRVENGMVRYALAEAVFSYAPSARLLCDLARRDPVPLDGGGLVVGDPDTAGDHADLPAARAEASAVREGFYPRARYVGRAPHGAADGPGRRGDLVGWLADERAGNMLHLACHAVVRPGSGDTSYLLLADGERLSAEELVRAAPGRPIALAVLAACGSGVCNRADDEAFSLSTTLLANNTATVIGTQWSVPDGATSVLMYMFHRYLRRDGLPPPDALRAAQLWMVSGSRTVPADMPDGLRAALRRAALEDPVGWAAFIHSGR